MLIRPWLVHQWVAQLSRSAGRTLIIRGPWASAKSDYLVHTAEHYAASLPQPEKGVLLLSGKRLLSNVPRSALDGARWLVEPDGDGDSHDAPASTRPATVPHKRRQPNVPSLQDTWLLAIDDLQHLDEASAHEAVASAARGELSIVATLLAGTHLPEPFRALLRQGSADLVELALLNVEEIRRTAGEILDGEPDEETLDLLFRWTGGRPRWIVPVLDWLAQHGQTAESDTGFHREATPSATDIVGKETFLGFLSELDPQAKQLLGDLASWGPMQLELAVAKFGPGAIKTLLAMRLVDAGLPLRAELTQARATLQLRISGELLVIALRQRALGNEAAARNVDRTEAAQRAQQLFLALDFERAADLEPWAADADAGADAADARDVRSAKLLAELLTGRWDELNLTIASISEEGLAGPFVSQDHRITSVFEAGLECTEVLRIGSRSAAQFLRSARALTAGGHLRAAWQEIEWVLAVTGSEHPAAQEWALFLARSQFLAIALLSADWASARALASTLTARGDRGWRAARGTLFASRALTRMFQGLFADSFVDARQALESLEKYDPFYLSPLAASVGLYAASQLHNGKKPTSKARPRGIGSGDAEPSADHSTPIDFTIEATRLLPKLEPRWWAAPDYPFLDLTLGVLNASEGPAPGAEQWPALSDDLGTPLSQAISLSLAGGVKTKGAMEDALSTGGPSWVDTLVTYKRRLTSARGLTAILDIADEAASRNLLRVQHLAHELALKRGYSAPAIAAARDRIIRIEQEGMARMREDSAAIHLDSLTEREREIASIAAKNHSSAAIASRLGVSVRTVEGHLQRAYQKLGVHTRSQLDNALNSSTISFGKPEAERQLSPSAPDPLNYAPRLLGNTT
ncbi:helix-turn-helix domain-containing protein [Haematomicrobium sanguinis]|uniref:helix-turn-helix domain-containing protein n=1 Tax=Haematomicrobium sanguinis TaxID=479106 RepID=UPI000A4865E7|nr:helix-turn-helix transcriptional regulator [Haematomicrobium sanguinis]